jgi:hypothetical protein
MPRSNNNNNHGHGRDYRHGENNIKENLVKSLVAYDHQHWVNRDIRGKICRLRIGLMHVSRKQCSMEKRKEKTLDGYKQQLLLLYKQLPCNPQLGSTSSPPSLQTTPTQSSTPTTTTTPNDDKNTLSVCSCEVCLHIGEFEEAMLQPLVMMQMIHNYKICSRLFDKSSRGSHIAFSVQFDDIQVMVDDVHLLKNSLKSKFACRQMRVVLMNNLVQRMDIDNHQCILKCKMHVMRNQGKDMMKLLKDDKTKIVSIQLPTQSLWSKSWLRCCCKTTSSFSQNTPPPFIIQLRKASLLTDKVTTNPMCVMFGNTAANCALILNSGKVLAVTLQVSSKVIIHNGLDASLKIKATEIEPLTLLQKSVISQLETTPPLLTTTNTTI